MADNSLRVAQVYTEFETKGLTETANGINKLRGQINTLKNLMAGFIGGFTLKAVASQFINAARTAEDYRTSIRAVSKSVEDADATFARIKNWAAVNPIDTDQAVGAFVRLRTASVENSEAALKAVADVATVMHRDVRDVASAVVSMETETLRNIGIVLDQSGKKAILTSNGIRIEANKDVASVRAAIIELMGKAFGGGMDEAKNTFSGALSTMSGMWQNFQNDVMGEGENSGPFQMLKDELTGVNDEWEKFTKSEDYKTLINDIQGTLVSAINMAKDGVIALGNGFMLAKEYADELKAIVVALAVYKLTMRTEELIANLRSAVELSKSLLLLKSLTSPVGLIAASLAAIAGLAIYSKQKKDARELEEQAKRTKTAIESLNTELKNASAAQIKTAIAAITIAMKAAVNKIEELKKKLNSLTDDFTNETTMMGKRAIGQNIKSISDQIADGEKEVSALKTKLATAQEMLKNAVHTKTPDGSSSDGAKSGSSKSSGKSAAEKLVENIRDQIKYLNADGESFLPVLEKWIGKSKALSGDWKTLKDLYNEITENAEARDPMSALRRSENLKAAKERMAALSDEAEQLRQAEYDVYDWQNQMGLMSDTDYIDKLRENFARLRDEFTASGGSMENYLQWPQRLRDAYTKLSNALTGEVKTAFESLKDDLDAKKINVDEFKQKVQELIGATEDPQAKQAVEALFKAYEEGADKAGSKIIDLTAETQKWVEDFQSGIADAIVEGEGLADTINSITKELAKMAVKVALFGNNGQSGLLGGFISRIFGGFHAGGIVGGSPTFSRRIELPRFHTGGIVGADERLLIARKGEGVFTQEQMKAMGGAGGARGNTFAPNISVKIENTGSGNMDQAQAEQMGRQLNDAVSMKVAEELYKYQRQGLLRIA